MNLNQLPEGYEAVLKCLVFSFGAVTGSASASVDVRLEEGDFFLTSLASVQTSASFTLQIRDLSRDRDLFSAAAPAGAVLGTAQNPHPLFYPSMFPRGGTLRATVTDTSESTNTITVVAEGYLVRKKSTGQLG